MSHFCPAPQPEGAPSGLVQEVGTYTTQLWPTHTFPSTQSASLWHPTQWPVFTSQSMA